VCVLLACRVHACSARAVYMLCVCCVCMQCTCSVRAVCVQCVCSARAVCVQRACSVCAVHVQCACRLRAACVQRTCSVHAVCVLCVHERVSSLCAVCVLNCGEHCSRALRHAVWKASSLTHTHARMQGDAKLRVQLPQCVIADTYTRGCYVTHAIASMSLHCWQAGNGMLYCTCGCLNASSLLTLTERDVILRVQLPQCVVIAGMHATGCYVARVQLPQCIVIAGMHATGCYIACVIASMRRHCWHARNGMLYCVCDCFHVSLMQHPTQRDAMLCL